MDKNLNDGLSAAEFTAGVAVENFVKKLVYNSSSVSNREAFDKAFNQIDLDDNGTIDPLELKEYIKKSIESLSCGKGG